MMSSYTFRRADLSDIANIVELVNLSYRSQELRGWTSEADIVNGDRTTHAQMNMILNMEHSSVLLMQQPERLMGCVHLLKRGASCDIGMLTIHPLLQNKGMGKILLKQAEACALEQFKSQCLQMSVLSVREELLQFYQRRGYQLTGQSEAYPYAANVGIPLYANIRVLKLLKQIE